MNYAEILALPAGRELDYLVAEKVLRQQTCQCDHRSGLVEGALQPIICFDCSLVIPGEHSTDIGAAWQVVERFRADLAFPWTTNFSVFAAVDVARQRREYVVDFAGGNCPGRACGETLPLAVCRAALSLVLT